MMEMECPGQQYKLVNTCPEPGSRGCDTCIGALARLAFTDELTGIPNRRALNLHIQECIEQEADVAAISIDLTNFKLINQQFGHRFGDKLLQYVAHFFNSNLRVSNSGNKKPPREQDKLFVARRSGDEFTIIVSPASNDRPNLPRIAQRVGLDFEEDDIIGELNELLGPENAVTFRTATSWREIDMSTEDLLHASDMKGHEMSDDPIPELVYVTERLTYKMDEKLAG